MNEDWMLDENFRVESASDFINGLNEEEEHFLIHNSGMEPCKNCGEWVTSKYMKTGICNMCNQSDFHAEKRGMSENASDNHRCLETLVKRLEELRD